MKINLTDNKAIASLFAVIIPLIQLIGVLIESFNAKLNLENLFVNNEILVFLNIVSVLLVISVLSWYWYYVKNQVYLRKNAESRELTNKDLNKFLSI